MLQFTLRPAGQLSVVWTV